MAEIGWGEMLRTAMALGLSPDRFWRLSLREWRMLTEQGPAASAVGRTDLERLMAAWPDGDAA